MTKIRIATYNIHMGISPFRRRNVLDAIELVLRDTDADVLCLQEDLQVDSLTEFDIATRCNEVWGNNIFGKTVIHPRGVQGNSIISKYPILYSEIISLPTLEAQPRSLLRADINISETLTLPVYCAHFGLSEKQRKVQSKMTADLVTQAFTKDSPVVLAGDFNDWRGGVSRYFQESLDLKEVCLPTTGKPYKTFPAIMPCLCLDRIFYKNLELCNSFTYSKATRLGKSDHLPFVADFLFNTN